MKVLDYESTNRAKDERGPAVGVDANLGFHFVWSFGVKGFEAKSAELSGLAAAGSWRLAGANLNLVAELVALELAGVNGASMVSAGSNSSPRSDSLGWSDDGQGVAHIDVDYFVPSDGNRSEWVGDNHAFIKDFDLWSYENQVCRNNAGGSPEAPADGRQAFFGQPEGYCEQRGQDQNQPRKNVATARSKNLFITHVSIIAGDK